MVQGDLFPLFELFFQLKIGSEGLGIYLIKIGQKVFAQILIIFVQILQD